MESFVQNPGQEDQWTPLEEHALIQGIYQMGGPFNWQDISARFVPLRSAAECQSHYHQYLAIPRVAPVVFPPPEDKPATPVKTAVAPIFKVNKPSTPTPPPPKAKEEPQVILDDEKAKRNLKRLREYQARVEKEKADQENEFGGQQWGGKVKDSATGQGGQRREVRENAGVSELHGILGYLPKRGDFEQEYDHEADELLAALEYNSDDSPEVVRVKNDLVESYNQRLDDRKARKELAINSGLLDIRPQRCGLEKKKTKEEREIFNAMKIFTRFNTPDDHRKMVSSLIRERQLREVIDQLKFFEQRGLQSLDQIEKYIEMNKIAQSNQSIGDRDQRRQWLNAQYSECEDFLKNPRDYLSFRDAEVLEKHSSMSKRFCDREVPPLFAGAIPNSMMVMAPDYDLLNLTEKDLCEKLNVLPTEYICLMTKIHRERGKGQIISRKLLEDLIIQLDLKSLTPRHAGPLWDFFEKVNIIS